MCRSNTLYDCIFEIVFFLDTIVKITVFKFLFHNCTNSFIDWFSCHLVMSYNHLVRCFSVKIVLKDFIFYSVQTSVIHFSTVLANQERSHFKAVLSFYVLGINILVCFAFKIRV